MQKVFTLLLVVASYASTPAQSMQRRFVVWGGDTRCGHKSLSILPDESISCQSLNTPRGNISVVNHNGISLAVGFLEDDDFIIVATRIENTTAHPFEFDTDLWGAAHFASGESFASGVKPITAETAMPSRDIVRGITSGVALDNSMDTFMASISKTGETKEVRSADGTRVKKVVITDDREAQRIAGSRNDSRKGHAFSEQERIRKTAMTQKWLPAMASTKGLVYFRRVKKAGLVVFSFKLLDTTYVFRLLRDKS